MPGDSQSVLALKRAARKLVDAARRHPGDRPLQSAADAVESALPGDVGRPPKVTDQQCHDAYEEHGSYAAAARSLGVSEATVRRRVGA